MIPLRHRIALACAAIFAPVGAMAYSSNCQSEIGQYCGNIEPGAGRQTACIIQSKMNLSPMCRTEVYAALERRLPFKIACKADAMDLCPEISPGKGRLYTCLRFNADHLSAACKEQALQ